MKKLNFVNLKDINLIKSFARQESEENMNFVKELGEGDSLWDFVSAPCIMLISNYENKFRYCHFDEYNLEELKGFIDFAYENGNNKVGFFGGWGSKNVSKLIRHLNGKEMSVLSQKDFVDFFPLDEIVAWNGIFYCLGRENKREYSFRELHNLLR
jgi:hypothetical protein